MRFFTAADPIEIINIRIPTARASVLPPARRARFAGVECQSGPCESQTGVVRRREVCRHSRLPAG